MKIKPNEKFQLDEYKGDKDYFIRSSTIKYVSRL